MLRNAANIGIGDQIVFDTTLPITNGNIYGGEYYYITSVTANVSVSTANIQITNQLNGTALSNLLPASWPTVTVTVANVVNTTAYPVSSSIAYYITTADIAQSNTFDYANVQQVASPNILGQIRRGTQGTAVANTYPIGVLVTDASSQQEVQGSVSGNVTLVANTSYTVTDTVSYTLILSNTIAANVGDTITQTTTGTNATVLAFENTAYSNVLVRYNNSATFSFLSNTIVASSNIAINGVYTGNTYPISSIIAGNSFVSGDPSSYSSVTGYGLDSNGNVTVRANTRLQTANIWLNLGTGTATDGTGFISANTAPANFIKQELAVLNARSIKPDDLGTEDAINTLTTEDGNIITEE
jgi:hypothetical protein